MQTIHQAHPCFGIQQQFFTWVAQQQEMTSENVAHIKQTFQHTFTSCTSGGNQSLQAAAHEFCAVIASASQARRFSQFTADKICELMGKAVSTSSFSSHTANDDVTRKRKFNDSFDEGVRRSKRLKSQAADKPAVTDEKKPTLQQICGIITQKIIKEKMGLVNPTGGQECCIPCSISGFNWLYYQKENPDPVEDVVTPLSTWGTLTNRPDYYEQGNLTPPDLDYLTLDYPEQAARLPAAVTIKVEQDITVNGHPVEWAQETVIDDSRHYIFKKITSDAFQDMLDKIPLKKWHNNASQAGLVNFFKQTDPNKGHMVCFYIYKCGNRKPVKLLIDFQHRRVLSMSQLPNIIAKYAYNPVFYYWYNNPIIPLITTVSFSRLKTKRTQQDSMELSPLSAGAESFVIVDDDELMNDRMASATTSSIEDAESSVERQTVKRKKSVRQKLRATPLTPEEEKAILEDIQAKLHSGPQRSDEICRELGLKYKMRSTQIRKIFENSQPTFSGVLFRHHTNGQEEPETYFVKPYEKKEAEVTSQQETKESEQSSETSSDITSMEESVESLKERLFPSAEELQVKYPAAKRYRRVHVDVVRKVLHASLEWEMSPHEVAYLLQLEIDDIYNIMLNNFERCFKEEDKKDS